MINYKSKHRKFYENHPDFDNMYVVDIHVWRQPGMGNSLQTITGSNVSILTAVASLMETLMIKTEITKEQLQDALNMASENVSNHHKN